MIDTSNLNWIWVVAITFVPMFICASLLQAKGITGVLAIVGAIGIAVVVLLDFQGWRLGTGGVAALVGLVIGGKLSDSRELKRKQLEQAEKRRR